MATIVSKFSDGQYGINHGECVGGVVVNNYFVDLTAAQLAKDNVIDIGILPANHTVVDAILIPDDLDSGTPAITLDIGLMSGTPGSTGTRTVGTELWAASTAAQGGTVTRLALATGWKIAPSGTDRSIGVLIKAAPGTAAAGRLRLTLLTAPMDAISY